MDLQFSIRKWEGSAFGEAHEYERGEDLAAFDSYVEQFAIGDVEDEPARPFAHVIAGRKWTDNDGQEWSAFAKKVDGDI